MDKELFSSRIKDSADICFRTGVPKFLGFLTEEEASAALYILEKLNVKYSFFGGYDMAERQYLAFLPEWCDDARFPISSLSFSFRECDTLGHRDFLGALMSLGITRECVGDILVEPGRAVVFVSDNIAEFTVSQIEKIGRVGVIITDGFSLPLPSLGKLSDFTDTIASERLDCIVASLCSTSRKNADALIESGMVSVNSFIVQKSTKAINNADKITIRGKGKFIISSIDDRSKKGRIILKYKKYI